MSHYPNLFSPITIGRTLLRNRIVVPPMATRMAPDGVISDREIAWGVERAFGGASLVITAGIHVHPTSLTSGNPGRQVEGWRTDGVESHRQRVDAIHAGGAKVFAQLAHVGRDAIMEQIGPRMEEPLLAPSAIRSPAAEWAPCEMDHSQIRQLVVAFGEVAALLQGAGYDGIEVHGGHGYLVAQFLSATTNHRTDEFGCQTLDNRTRFLREVISEIRQRCGDDMTLGVRFSAVEEVVGGIEIADTIEFVNLLEEQGGVDYVSLTVGVRGAYVKDSSTPPGFATSLSAAVRASTTLPVLVSGRITTPELAESILAEGAADLVGMARALIADPLLPTKAIEGRRDSIRPCIGFSQECRLTKDGITCGVNASAGREVKWSNFSPIRSRASRRVAIAGGGPAGLEAARVAADLGHDVVLFEAGTTLGGQLRRAARAPYRQDFDAFAGYLEHEVRKLGVDVRLGERATAAGVIDLSPDVIIIATGSLPGALPWPIDRSSIPIVRTWDLMDGQAQELGPRVLVVDDGTGFWPVCGAADLLASRGMQLEFATPNAVIGRSIPHESIGPLHRRLRGAGAKYLTFTRVVGVDGRTAQLVDTITGEHRSLEVDALVVDVAHSPVADLDELFSTGVPTHKIGDSLAPRRLSYATLEANRVIRDLE